MTFESSTTQRPQKIFTFNFILWACEVRCAGMMRAAPHRVKCQPVATGSWLAADEHVQYVLPSAGGDIALLFTDFMTVVEPVTGCWSFMWLLKKKERNLFSEFHRIHFLRWCFKVKSHQHHKVLIVPHVWWTFCGWLVFTGQTVGHVWAENAGYLSRPL